MASLPATPPPAHLSSAAAGSDRAAPSPHIDTPFPHQLLAGLREQHKAEALGGKSGETAAAGGAVSVSPEHQGRGHPPSGAPSSEAVSGGGSGVVNTTSGGAATGKGASQPKGATASSQTGPSQSASGMQEGARSVGATGSSGSLGAVAAGAGGGSAGAVGGGGSTGGFGSPMQQQLVTRTSSGPQSTGAGSSAQTQQLSPAFVSPYLAYAAGEEEGAKQSAPASATLPVAALPAELKLVVEGAIRLYTSVSHRQAQAIVSNLYSRSAWYEGPLLLVAGRSSLVTLAGLLRALCVRVEVQARPVTVTEPVACAAGKGGAAGAESGTPAADTGSTITGKAAAAAKTAVTNTSPQPPASVFTLTIPTVQRWHLRPWPARVARLLGQPTSYRLHITSVVTLNADTDRVVSHQDVVAEVPPYLPAWLRAAAGVPVSVAGALAGL